jgi:uncharacterized caspase-like protein
MKSLLSASLESGLTGAQIPARLTRRHLLRLAAAGLLLPAANAALAGAAEGRRYALVVGISNYKHGYALLDYAGDDADKIKAALKGLGYAVSSLTTDARAGSVDRDTLLKAIRDLIADRKPEDTILFYFSGHGSLRNGKQYLLCTDTDPNLFDETAFSLDTLGRLLGECQAGHRVLIIDACRDTSKADGVSGFAEGRLDQDFKDRLDAIARKAPAGLAVESVVLYACRPGQRSKESDAERAGFFTLRLVDALNGKATPNGPMTAGAVMRYVTGAMPAALHGIQDPTLEGNSQLLLGGASGAPVTRQPAAEARRPATQSNGPAFDASSVTVDGKVQADRPLERYDLARLMFDNFIKIAPVVEAGGSLLLENGLENRLQNRRIRFHTGSVAGFCGQEASLFQDVPTTHAAYEAVVYCQQHGLLIGYPEGYYRGKRSVTRYEFCTALSRLLRTIGKTVRQPEAHTLPADVLPNSWAYESVASLFAAGLLTAGKDQQYHGNAVIPVGEALSTLKLVFRLLHQSNTDGDH